MLARARTAERKLAEIEESERRLTAADARIREAKAKKAESRASFEAERQRQAIIDRKTKRRMGVLLTVFSMAYLAGALLVFPWIVPTTGVAAALAYRWR